MDYLDQFGSFPFVCASRILRLCLREGWEIAKAVAASLISKARGILGWLNGNATLDEISPEYRSRNSDRGGNGGGTVGFGRRTDLPHAFLVFIAFMQQSGGPEGQLSFESTMLVSH